VEQILIVDGQSKDGTADYARQQGYEVYVQKERGIRKAFIEAWPLIRGETVITFSPDGNCIPELIPALIEKMNDGYDMVIASRYLEGARSYDDNWITGFGNWFFTRILINGLYGGRYTDAMGMYRAYKTRLFYDLDIDKEDAYVPEKCWFTVMGCEPLISTRMAKRRMRVAEIPGDEPKRARGQAKLQVIRWGGAYLFQIIRELWHWK
jgi:glycosyltransferase involved in cell wall biosynthesis